ncbi:cysteine desulfurase NifS [bacterium]|nr:cysteine desulfurase NifS [Candidatus Omnitrophota bacterium]MBU2527907.1 cysteine desulfurase NifS [bacterium]MBU3929260.1 cysteine desulfurase NifS [bacterium]MBU4123837.1 cysteine desulfurase NifS [bacterium]
MIYLDHNATTPVHPEVLDAMLPFYKEVYGNASSIHAFGRAARSAVEESREKIAAFIGASEDEIIFTSGGTESDNTAIRGVMEANASKGNHIITSVIEHHAVLNTCKYLEKKGFRVTYLPVDEFGVISIDELKKAITDETVLITIMHANNETGTLQPLVEIGAIAREKGIIFHSDAVQSLTKVPLNVDKMNADLLSFSGHKIYAPKGAGVLYKRKGVKMSPLLLGGHHEKNRRAGTENVAGIVGFAKAIEIARRDGDSLNKRIEGLRDRLWKGIKDNIKDVKLNGHPDKRTPNTLNVSFKFVEGESIILNLDMEGVAVSSGSACTSGSLSASHVLLAMGLDHAIAQGSIRFSLGKDNSEEDIDFVTGILPGIINKLRAMSPLYEQ